jgi:hypothetical protein
MTITGDGVAYMVLDKTILDRYEIKEGDYRRFLVCPKVRCWRHTPFRGESFKSGRRCVEILQDQLRDNVVLLISRIFS